jgi:hypothetical protein
MIREQRFRCVRLRLIRIAAVWLGLLDVGRADAIAGLSSPDLAARRQAIADIQTLDDPRIPPLCLPLLTDPGLSIRRLAARAIGSRFYRIGDTERTRYLAALRVCLSSRQGQPAAGNYADEDDSALLCQRAIGLLARRYDTPPFSVSPNGQWVLYERRRLPVVANIPEQVHHLLAPVDPRGPHPDDAYFTNDGEAEDPRETDLLKTVETNLPASQLFAPHWRPDGEALAFSFERLEQRFYHPILIWIADAPAQVVVLDEASFQKLLGKRYPQWSTTTAFVGWDQNKVIIKVYNCDWPGRDAEHGSGDLANFVPDPGVMVSFDPSTKKIALAP